MFLLLFFPIFYVSAEENNILNRKIRILLVPGHDNDYPGASFGDRREADMTLDLATRIFNSLKDDNAFEVHITRDKDGYTKEFSDYFNLNVKEINSFKENAKQAMKQNVANGYFLEKKNVPHVGVNSETALHLYGINKWANENKMDAVIHIHFNDYPRSFKLFIGKYTGFAVYYPDSELLNGENSLGLASVLHKKLLKKYSPSNYKMEKGGLISDQKLIALGANNTLNKDIKSVLIEYGYIYEKKFRQTKTRENVYVDMADLTINGIKDYFKVK